jgi:fumarate reductase subunit D
MPDIDTTLAAASAAVTGDQTPEAIRTTQSVDTRLIWALIGAGPALSGMVLLLVVILRGFELALILWLTSRPDALQQVAGLAVAALNGIVYVTFGLVFCLALVIWRLAGVKRMEAKAGPVAAVVDS